MPRNTSISSATTMSSTTSTAPSTTIDPQPPAAQQEAAAENLVVQQTEQEYGQQQPQPQPQQPQERKEIHDDILHLVKTGNLDGLRRRGSSRSTTRKSYSLKVIPQAHDASGCTALHWAAGLNHLHIVHYLLGSSTSGATVEEDDSNTTITDSTRSVVLFPNVNYTIPLSFKAGGKTALHYAARNGHLKMVQTLVEEYGADWNIRAKHGVTPFQLAVWQNRLDVCRYLVHMDRSIISGSSGSGGGLVPVAPLRLQVNDFGCGALHWMGICPLQRAEGIVDLAKWLLEEEEDEQQHSATATPEQNMKLNVYQRQNQGRTVLHKASWGGHLELVRYLHEQHGMYDDIQDHAGNYAADLADMANTERHGEIAFYLRRECSREYHESCNMLGLNRDKLLEMCTTSRTTRKCTATTSKNSTTGDDLQHQDCSNHDKDVWVILDASKKKITDMIQKAYLAKAREYHPDSGTHHGSTEMFQALKKARDHLMYYSINTYNSTTRQNTKSNNNGDDDRRNNHGDDDDDNSDIKTQDIISTDDEVHDRHLLVPQSQKNPMHCIHKMIQVQQQIITTAAADNKEQSLSYCSNGEKLPGKQDTELLLFQPRLMAVLLEYGDKGIHLSNIPKVWNKVWPNNPFSKILIEDMPSAVPRSEAMKEATTASSHSSCLKIKHQKKLKKRKRGRLLRLIETHAGDVVQVIRQEKGIIVKPKHVRRQDILVQTNQ